MLITFPSDEITVSNYEEVAGAVHQVDDNETKDPDYDLRDEEDVDSSSDEDTKRQTKRQRKPSPADWKKNATKNKRKKGVEYISTKGKEIPARSVGELCTSFYCIKSDKRDCQDISRDVQLAIFKYFWVDLTEWSERKVYVSTLVSKVPIKQKTTGVNSRRQNTWEYSLSYQNKVYRVCKKLFAATVGLPERTVLSWLEQSDQATRSDDVQEETLNESCETITEEMLESSKKPKRIPKNITTEESRNYVKEFLESLATVPSHYCRAIYAQTKFLEPGTTMNSVFQEYRNKAGEDNVHQVSYPVFKKIFDESKYSVFVPRKDQCDVCLGFKHSSVSKEEYEKHRNLKDQARDMKTKDKTEAQENNQVSAWTMDMQAVMVCPKSLASCMYYKTKLQLHNFTFYCLEDKAGYCYAWDEVNADLSCETFAWLQFYHFRKFLEEHSDIKILIVWSDGCGYQNRNATLSNAYLHLAKLMKVTIYQKFLMSGHSQMECDSMHSMIERKLKGPMYTPREYIVAMQSARSQPMPYHVEHLKHDFFKKGFQDMYVSSIRPGKKSGDPTIHDLRVIRYSEDGICYQTSFQEEPQPLPQ